MSEKGYLICGDVKAGFEPIRELFDKKFQEKSEEHSQLCIYVGGEKVVDLWGTVDPDSKFDANSLINVYSSTKSLTAIMMAMAKDKGWLDYSDKICHHWPEFGQQGKSDITIADLMRHEAGLATFPFPLDPQDLTTANIKMNKTGEKIARMSVSFPPGKRREYHALTRGWVANEVFRRVHPQNLTLGEFLDKEVSTKLDADVYIGCSRPNFFPGRYDQVVENVLPMRELCRFENEFNVLDIMKDEFRGLEIPSANGNCSARGLASIGAAMAHKGRHPVTGTKLMSETAWEAMHADAIKDLMWPDDINLMCAGGIASFTGSSDKLRDGYFGWYGLGGSAFQWHPQLAIGFAYTCTLLSSVSTFQESSKNLGIFCRKVFFH